MTNKIIIIKTLKLLESNACKSIPMTMLPTFELDFSLYDLSWNWSSVLSEE